MIEFNNWKLTLRLLACVWLSTIVKAPDVRLVLLCAFSTSWRLFCVHGGGHRYFSHKSYSVPAWFELLMAYTISCTELNQLAYWTTLHNSHHAHCEDEEDFHSPVRKGFWKVQLTFNLLNEKELDKVSKMLDSPAAKKKSSTYYKNDLSRISLPISILALVLDNVGFLLLGYIVPDWTSLCVWYYLSLIPRFYTTMAANLTNSAGHRFGTRPYIMKGSRADCFATNCWWAAVLGGGEGWHNNHHMFALSARHGFYWYEIDTIFWMLCILGKLGIVTNMLVVSDAVKSAPADTDFSLFERKYDTWFKA